MASAHWLMLILLQTHNLLHCTSAAAHGHNAENIERESDGSYRPRDSEHYGDTGHNAEFDHEAILGSVKEAARFDKMSPEESKKQLELLLPKIDLNGDKFVDRDELKKWILGSFAKLAEEEVGERMQEVDFNQDMLVSWAEYMQDMFGVDSVSDVQDDSIGDSGALVQEEKQMWDAADENGDGVLDGKEFAIFANPEEHKLMHLFLVNQTMREKDTNNDDVIDFHEYVGERGAQQDKEWLVSEKEKFNMELDINKDGVLDRDEVFNWVIPNNDEIALEEVDHLFESADDNRDYVLSYAEVLRHHDVFVGSEATDYGDMLGQHFDDEL